MGAVHVYAKVRQLRVSLSLPFLTHAMLTVYSYNGCECWQPCAPENGIWWDRQGRSYEYDQGFQYEREESHFFTYTDSMEEECARLKKRAEERKDANV